MPLPDPVIEVLTTFRPWFTAPTWRKLMTLLTATRLSQGRRTVATALRHSGNAQGANFSSFHQVLNRAQWSPLALSRQLLLLRIGSSYQQWRVTFPGLSSNPLNDVHRILRVFWIINDNILNSSWIFSPRLEYSLYAT